MFQVKEQDKSPGRCGGGTNDMEISNLPDKEFKGTATKMFTDLEEELRNTVRISIENFLKSTYQS